MTRRKRLLNQFNAPNILQLAPAEIPGEPEWEEYLLARALSTPDIFPALIDMLSPEDFYLKRANLIWRAMEVVDKRGELIDLVGVKEELECHAMPNNKTTLDEVGGLDGLMAIASKQLDIPLSIEAIASVILTMAKRRRLAEFGNDVFKMALRRDMPLDDIAIELEKNMAVTLETVTRSEQRSFSDALASYYDHLEQMVGSGRAGLPTGFKSFDALTRGIHKGEVSVIAGHAGMGKTAVVLSTVCNVCENGGAVDFFPLEMSEEEIVRWIVSAITGISIGDLKAGALGVKELALISRAMAEIGSWQLRIHDDIPGMTPMEFKRRMTRVMRHACTDFTVIDGLWLMNADEPEDAGGVKDTNGKMRELAKIVKVKTGLGIPLWITHQMNQDTKKRPDKEPLQTDLQFGGSMDAHNVYALYREDYFTHIQSDRPTELQILKVRSGDYGTGYLRFKHPRYVDVTAVQS